MALVLDEHVRISVIECDEHEFERDDKCDACWSEVNDPAWEVTYRGRNVPGFYATPDAAYFACQFDDLALEPLVRKSCYQNDPITIDDLRGLMDNG